MLCFTVSLGAFAQGVEVKLEYRSENCSSDYLNNPQYIADIYVRHTPTTGNKYLGNTSIYFTYDAEVLRFTDYQSSNFNEYTRCYVRNMGVVRPYSDHSFDGDVPGNFLLTFLLRIPSLAGGNGSQACLNINNNWIKVGSTSFEVLDMQTSPNFHFFGTNGDYPLDTRGTNFSQDNNEDKYKQYFVESPQLSYAQVCSNANQACCPVNATYTGPLPPYTAVENTIVANQTSVGASGDVVFQAGEQIELNADFEVAKGGNFDAYIAACDATICNNTGGARLGETSTETTLDNPVNLEVKAYPNPFDHSTQISFSISEASNTSIIIYDAQGKAIQRLIDNESKEAGTHEIIFDASTLKSGVYFYTVQVGYKEVTNKLVVF